jgi:glycosyltransferase involved in cell wall biosynthesis
VPQTKLFELYASHNLLIYPSLHDSSGNVVLEALSRGMPVLCLDLGGPRDIVTPASGIVVRTAGRNTDQVAAAMADEMVQLFADPSRLLALSAGAVARASEFLLPGRVARLYEIVADHIDLSNADKGAPMREKAALSLRHPIGAEA